MLLVDGLLDVWRVGRVEKDSVIVPAGAGSFLILPAGSSIAGRLGFACK